MTDWFWSLIAKHNATEVRLLAALHAPMRGLEAKPDGIYFGELVLAQVPELGWMHWEGDGESGSGQLVAAGGTPDVDESDDEPFDFGPDRSSSLALQTYVSDFERDGLVEDFERGGFMGMWSDDARESFHHADDDPSPHASMTTDLGRLYLEFLGSLDEPVPRDEDVRGGE